MHQHTITDPVFLSLESAVVEKFGSITSVTAKKPTEYFTTLVESIVSQQLSVKVADVIFSRLQTQLGCIEPATILTTPVTDLRALGLSNSKAAYIHNLATAWTDGSIVYQAWENTADEEIIAQLTQVKGIGRWTAEMFLLSGLAREDVFSAGDYGLRSAITKAYPITIKEKPALFAAIAQQWSPHRSYASRILWRSLEL